MKLPYFPFYPNDWLSSPVVMSMTPEERGAYIQLLSVCWASMGDGIPDDDAVIGKLCGVKSAVVKMKSLFPIQENGRRYNDRLLKEWAKIKKERDGKSEGGRKYLPSMLQDTSKILASIPRARQMSDVINDSTNANTSTEPNTKTKENITPFAPSRKKSSVTAPSSKPEISFSFETGEFDGITEKELELWRSAYPAVDLNAQINSAAAWLVADPRRKKIRYRSFLTNWLSRSQQRGGR